MKLVLLCKRHNHRKVLEILSALGAQNLKVAGIVALEPREAWPSLKDVVRKIYYRRHAGIQRETTHPHIALRDKATPHGSDNTNGHIAAKPDGMLSVSGLYKTIADYARAHKIPLVIVPDLNGADCIAALRKFQTDVLLLGGTPIIRAQVLQTPRVGTLNVHMAWLPGIRGMNVAEWSVYTDAPIAVTVHFVDVGVDTGAVLYREEVDIADCHDIAAMRRKLSFEQHHALARAARLLFDQQLKPEPQARAAGKQYYLMHEKLKQVVAEKLRRE